MTSAHVINSALQSVGTVRQLFRLFSISNLAPRDDVLMTYIVADRVYL